MRQACDTIAAAATSLPSGRKLRLQELAAEANLTPSHFHRIFKSIAGVTPAQYARALRDATEASKEADFADIAGGNHALFPQDGHSNHWADLCQAQLDATIVPDTDFSIDDLIDWNLIDDTMKTVKEFDALRALGQ